MLPPCVYGYSVFKVAVIKTRTEMANIMMETPTAMATSVMVSFAACSGFSTWNISMKDDIPKLVKMGRWERSPSSGPWTRRFVF